MLSRGSLKFLLVLFFFFPSLSFADSINIGYLSFDVLIPGGPSPGVNIFSTGNLTGDFALLDDFPVLNSLTFLNATLTLTGDGGPVVIALGDLAPGFSTSSEFSETEFFSSAVFSATLDQATFNLDGGGTFIPYSLLVSATLLPTNGPYLTPGVDFVVLSASDTPASVPEPSALLLLGSGLVALIKVKRRIQV